jgi:hypothetical protein
MIIRGRAIRSANTKGTVPSKLRLSLDRAAIRCTLPIEQTNLMEAMKRPTMTFYNSIQS